MKIPYGFIHYLPDRVHTVVCPVCEAEQEAKQMTYRELFETYASVQLGRPATVEAMLLGRNSNEVMALMKDGAGNQWAMMAQDGQMVEDSLEEDDYYRNAAQYNA